jgi:serine O-acetyltransferase
MSGIASLNQHAVKLHRIAHRFHRGGRTRLALGTAALSKALTGVEIEPGARIGENFTIVHGVGLVIGQGSVIGANCTVYQGVTLGTRYDVPSTRSGDHIAGEPTLGDGVVIYAGAKIFGPVSIGDGAVIAANAVVLVDVPAHKLAVGVPARVRDLRADAGRGGLPSPDAE